MIHLVSSSSFFTECRVFSWDMLVHPFSPQGHWCPTHVSSSCPSISESLCRRIHNNNLAQPCAKSRAFHDKCDWCERCETHRNALETPCKTPCRGTCCRWSCFQTGRVTMTHRSAHLRWDCFHWDARCEMRGEPGKCDGFQATKQNTDPPKPRRSCCSCWTLQKHHAGHIYKQKLLWNHSQRWYCSLCTPRQIKETQGLSHKTWDAKWLDVSLTKIFHFDGYNWSQTLSSKPHISPLPQKLQFKISFT